MEEGCGERDSASEADSGTALSVAGPRGGSGGCGGGDGGGDGGYGVDCAMGRDGCGWWWWWWWVWSTLRASLSGIFLQTPPDLVTPLKGHSLSPRSCPATRSASSERFGYNFL